MRLVLLAALLLVPLAAAQPSTGIDATITLAADAPAAIAAPPGLVRVENETPGERYELDLTLTRDYTTLEIRARGFDLDRPRQLVPSLMLPETEFPLFERFPTDEIWDVDSPANVFFTNGTADDVVLRLGVTGPRNVTLLLVRDVDAPTYEAGPIENVTHFSFYQETRTHELTIGDLQVRRAGTQDWVVNPTPLFHFRQRFPVQGLLPETEYEARLVFTDWAGNVATSDIYRVTSAAEPVRPTPVVTPLAPLPNSTINETFVTFRARIESPDSPLLASALSVFLDKRAITSDLRYEDNELRYSPPEPLAPGKHSFAVEVYNEAGGKGETHWTFTVAGAQKETPLPTLVAGIGLVLAALVARRRT